MMQTLRLKCQERRYLKAKYKSRALGTVPTNRSISKAYFLVSAELFLVSNKFLLELNIFVNTFGNVLLRINVIYNHDSLWLQI